MTLPYCTTQQGTGFSCLWYKQIYEHAIMSYCRPGPVRSGSVLSRADALLRSNGATMAYCAISLQVYGATRSLDRT